MPRRHAVRSRSLGVLAALTVVSGTARAEPSPLALDWTTPPGCPTAADVRARVSALIGATVDLLPRPVTVKGVVAVEGGAARLHLDTLVVQERSEGPDARPPESLHGVRDLTGATCEEVSAAGALVVALAIDAKAVEEQSRRAPVAAFGPPSDSGAVPAAAAPTAPPPAPSATSPAAPAPIPLPAPSPAPRGASSTPTRGQITARLLGELGALPGPTLGAGLGAGFAVDRIVVRVEGAYFFPRFAEAPTPAADGSARGASISLVAFDVAGCYAVVPGTLELDACAALEPGALLAVGSGFDRSTSAIAMWLAAGGSAEVSVNVAPPLSVRAGLGAVIPFGRSRVQFGETSGNSSTSVNLDRPAAVSARAFAGAGLSF